MVESIPTSPIRICMIAGRYLVFDADAVAFLRRAEGINGNLAGTAPQQPTQNIFLSLPAELRPEEAETLLQHKVAYLVDDVAAHEAALREPDPQTRKAYLDSLRTRKLTAQRVLAHNNAQRAAKASGKRRTVKDASPLPQAADTSADDALFSSSPAEPSKRPANPAVKSLAVTPTSSGFLISPSLEMAHQAASPDPGPLCRYLLSAGHYMTPGLRFGAQYSVYPGDPLRFHAHFMANQYAWDEKVPVLDLVTGGRLATAVKKAFLVGGEQPASKASNGVGQIRSFSIEWAAM